MGFGFSCLMFAKNINCQKLLQANGTIISIYKIVEVKDVNLFFSCVHFLCKWDSSPTHDKTYTIC
jgi:hypothetical protein